MTRRSKLAVSVVGVAVTAASVALYTTLDLREPARTRDLMAAFERGEPGAWDDFKMDAPRSARAVPALLESLRSQNATVRERAVVGACGLSRSDEVLQAMHVAAHDGDAQVNGAARHCLRYTYATTAEP